MPGLGQPEDSTAKVESACIHDQGGGAAGITGCSAPPEADPGVPGFVEPQAKSCRDLTSGQTAATSLSHSTLFPHPPQSHFAEDPELPLPRHSRSRPAARTPRTFDSFPRNVTPSQWLTLPLPLLSRSSSSSLKSRAKRPTRLVLQRRKSSMPPLRKSSYVFTLSCMNWTRRNRVRVSWAHC